MRRSFGINSDIVFLLNAFISARLNLPDITSKFCSREATEMGSYPASGGYKYRGLVLQDGGWAWG
jgi:hypothetical protein